MISTNDSFWERTMAAAAAATKTAPQMIRGGENHHASLKVKITGQNFLPCGRIFCAVEFRHAVLADTGTVTQVIRHARKERRWNFDTPAPARAFVGGGRTELTSVRPAAQGTLRWIYRAHGTLTSRR
jgi:hypothetical protein